MQQIEFFYQKFFYNKNTLCPRLETESLVRFAIETIKTEKIHTLIDVWTGSWIIPISIKKNCNLQNIYWLEKSKKAIKVANLNKKNLFSDIQIIESDLLKFFLKNTNFEFNKKIIITANLPYIKNEDWENMSNDTIFEPKMALFWWKKTGFELYEKFIKQIVIFQNIYKIKQLFTIIEIWFDQKKVAENFFNKMWLKFEFLKDLRWIDRFVKFEIISL